MACIAVNDPFVLAAWAKTSGGNGKVLFLSDGNAEFATKIGMDFDGSGVGLGTRSKRYAALVEDGAVKAWTSRTLPASPSRAPPRNSSIGCNPSSSFLLLLRWGGRNGSMPSRASSSARSFASWPAWPLTQCHARRAACGLLEPLPQVGVLHRFLVGGAPAVASSSP